MKKIISVFLTTILTLTSFLFLFNSNVEAKNVFSKNKKLRKIDDILYVIDFPVSFKTEDGKYITTSKDGKLVAKTTDEEIFDAYYIISEAKVVLKSRINNKFINVLNDNTVIAMSDNIENGARFSVAYERNEDKYIFKYENDKYVSIDNNGIVNVTDNLEGKLFKFDVEIVQ